MTVKACVAVSREKAGGLFDHLVYFPIDIPRFTMQAMLKVRPDSVAIMETDILPPGPLG